MTQTGTATMSDPVASVERLLATQEQLVDELAELSRQQRDLITARQTDALLSLLAQRQHIVDRFLASQEALGRVMAAMDETNADRGDRDTRLRIHALADTISQRLAQVMADDQVDQQALEAGRDAVRRELDGVTVGANASRAYRTARPAECRFADRQG